MSYKFVKFEDDSPSVYPSYEKKSLYVPGFDGTRLALDYLRPVRDDGTVETKPLPVAFMASRGGRFSMDRPNYPDNYMNGDGPLALYLVARGYVYVAAEMRGCGASFGFNTSFASPENRKDVAHLIAWICRQEWCDGNVGMLGGSNRSFIQMCTASAETPEGLKAITPCVSNINFYFTNYPNGVSRLPNKLLSGFMSSKKKTKKELLETVVPVDDDENGELAYLAYTQDQFPHNVNFMNNLILPNMCRDEKNEKYGCYPNAELTALPYTEKFVKSGIMQHQIAGWFDSSVGSQIAGCNAWGGSILIGPWSHQGAERGAYTPYKGLDDSEEFPGEFYNIGEEHKRWFDYSLKKIENGWRTQPKFHYYTINSVPGEHWRWSDSFPLKNTEYINLFLNDQKSGSCESENDGTLKPCVPENMVYTYQTRADIRYKEEVGGETYDVYKRHWNEDMSHKVDALAVTFTTDRLAVNQEMTGFPVIDLWVSSTIDDGDFIAVLEEITPEGESHFVTDGVIRASHRKVEPNVLYDTVGIPYHPGTVKDVRECLEEGMSDPVKLSFHMEPISYVFRAGTRIRLTIWCAEFVTYQHPMYDRDNMPQVTFYSSPRYPSKIVLPFIPERKKNYCLQR